MSAFVDNTAEESRHWYLHLHTHLNQLHDFLARQSIPHSYEAEGCQEVEAVMNIVERLTNQLSSPNRPTP